MSKLWGSLHTHLYFSFFKNALKKERLEGLKPIEEIEIGDKILAYDEGTGEQAFKPVVQLFRNETKEWYHIFVNGEEIVCTGGHLFYVVGEGFVEAKDLKISDQLLLSSGKRVIIEEIQVEQLEKPETTYNFEVADFHTYYVSASKVLVHNMCAKGKEFSDEQKALIELAKENSGGVTREQGNILVEWAKEYGLNNHAPQVHSQRSGIWSYTEHIKIFKYHIPIIK